MVTAKRRFLLQIFSAVCFLAVVVISASATAGTLSRPRLIGLVAGSFAAGATLVNAIRDHAANRGEKK
jgi:4-hydroxybenzoate polyprenyltransferase